MPSWSKLVAGWAVAALIALAFAWGAVAQVRSSVIQPTMEIPPTVVAAVAASDQAEASTTTIPLIRVEPEPGDDSASTSTTTLDTSVTSTTHAASGSTTTTTTVASQTTSTTTPSTTTTAALDRTETSTHTLVGGQVRISHSPGVVNFISAIPQPGFSTELEEDGPEQVRVKFESGSHSSEFRARWEDGELRITSNEEEED